MYSVHCTLYIVMTERKHESTGHFFSKVQECRLHFIKSFISSIKSQNRSKHFQQLKLCKYKDAKIVYT